MWWEYAIVIIALGAAVAYALWFISRAFRPGSGCGSSACHCSPGDDAAQERAPKVIPLVRVGTDKLPRP
jgi:hypothetical protein